ncbi:MAG: hypothetical protein HQL96_15950 [Magnetococcales bacterium]|nr:hypothetical protein [Magnetococcales bacterium]
MDTTLPIVIFQAGRHADMSGTTLDITEADLERTVAAYDPALWRAPLVIGHPRHDAPAWGWVASLSLQGGNLLAHMADLSPQVIDLVRAGHYRNVSASFYTPNGSGNPAPGLFYLRHVGLLGAQPPAVKGLPQVSFQEPAHDTALALGKELATPTDWNPTTMENAMTDTEEKQELARRRAELDAQTARFAEQAAEIAKREEQVRQAEAEQQLAKITEFVDALIADGKILPRFRDGLLAFLTFLSASGVVAFAEQGGQMEFIKSFLAELPRQVDYAERAPSTRSGPETARIRLPAGFTADPAGVELHGRILAYANAHKTDYLTAALAVSE